MSTSSNQRSSFFRGFVTATYLCLWALLIAVTPGVEYQTALGNSSDAVSDSSARAHHSF